MDSAFNYTNVHNGLCTEESYPYTAKENMCRALLCKKVAHVDSCYSIYVRNYTESFMERVIADRPFSIAVNGDWFQSYKEGIIDNVECDSWRVDHAVALVGYNKTDAGLHYWIIKNSWGSDWGDKGYIYIAKGKNLCGVAEYPSFPDFTDWPT